MRRALSCLCLTVALLVGAPVTAFEEEHTHYLSVSGLSEDRDGADLNGAKIAFVGWWDDHAPPVFLSIGAEYLEGDQSENIARATVALTVIVFPGGKRYGIALKPIVGVEQIDLGESSTDGLWGAGVEFGYRFTGRSQVALEYNWLRNFNGAESNQVGLGFRYSFW